jgi:transcriptional regulator with XRE-family HTH domain
MVALATRAEIDGHEITERRKRLRLTMRALAAASGVPLPVLSAAENGRRPLMPAHLQAIDGVLAPLEELCGFGPVEFRYIPAPGVSPARIEAVLRDVVAVLLRLRNQHD